MRIVDHEPHAWFLAEEDGALYLDVNCSRGPAGFTLMVRLTDDEATIHDRDGHAGIDRLAGTLDADADAVFAQRNCAPGLQRRLVDAIVAWRAGRSDG